VGSAGSGTIHAKSVASDRNDEAIASCSVPSWYRMIATWPNSAIATSGGTNIPPSPSTNNVCLDYAGLSSPDAGSSWSSQLRLTSDSSNQYIQFADGGFIGDYSQVAVGSDGKAHASWTDFRGRPGTTSANQDVYLSTFTP